MFNEKIIGEIIKFPLFKGVEYDEARLVLNCLQAEIKNFPKNTTVLEIGEKTNYIGVILEGSVLTEKTDFWGNRSILNKITVGDVFAESVCCSETVSSPINAVTAVNCVIMFIDYKRIITTCSSSCVFHTKLIENMLGILAEKNIMLTAKMEYLTRRSIKEKLLAYLSDCSQRAKSMEFDIPFNRQQLADFLAVDRSALSKVLSDLRDEGVLEYKKSSFVLYERD